MPKYKYALANGKTLTLEGDTQPSDEEVESLAKEQKVQLSPVKESKFEPKVDTSPSPDAIPSSDSSNESKESNGLLSKIWHGISDPLTDAPSRFANQVANTIDSPSLDTSPMMARIKGFGAGALQGLGDTISGMTSPLNLATAAMTGGGSLAESAGLSNIARGLNIGGRIASAPVVAHGAGQVLSPSSTIGERGFGLAEIAGGLAGMKEPSIESDVSSLIDQSKTKPIIPESVGPKQSLPIGSNIVIKKATPELVKKAKEQGFTFQGLNDEGHFRFKKTDEPTSQPIPQPILESEVGTTRPTSERQQMGPNVDVKKASMVAEAMNFPRTVMASMDMSAPLRQGIGLIHKKQFWTSFDDMFKAWGSEKAFNQVQQSIADKPLFKQRPGPNGTILPSFAEDAGLKLTDLTSITKREESLMSTWAEKIPGVRASNRAYTAFLNKLRADTFESLIDSGKIFGADGTTNIPLARALADFVNTATGRGSLGKLESSAVALNSVFFAPRLIASRLKILNPAYYVMADPMVRREALKSLFAIAGTGMALGQLSKMAGATVEPDPTSSDFGKIKIGNTRIDPFAGFQQYVVLANRLAQGRTKSSTSGREYNLGEKFGRPTGLDVAGRFVEQKTNPIVSFAIGLLRGKDVTGQPFNIPEEVASRFVPIILQDLKQLATENPNLIPGIHKEDSYGDFHPENLPMAVPSYFGMGVQQFSSQGR